VGGHFTPPSCTVARFSGWSHADHDNFARVMASTTVFRRILCRSISGQGRHAIEQAIAGYRFAYSQSAAPDTCSTAQHMPLSACRLGSPVFLERAFARERAGGRPTGTEWMKALGLRTRQRQPCGNSRAHWYHRSLSGAADL